MAETGKSGLRQRPPPRVQGASGYYRRPNLMAYSNVTISCFRNSKLRANTLSPYLATLGIRKFTLPCISETLKRGVALGLRTKVICQNGEFGDVTELLSSFPENLALTFCPSVTIKSVQKHGNAIVITGANAGAYLSLFEWMYACTDVKKVIAFPNFPDLIYYRAIYVEKAAKILGIAELAKAMRKRMASIARKQVHTDDVNKIYRDLACAEHKEAVTQSIARAIFEKRIMMEGKVNRLRREMPHVDDDVKYELECLKTLRQKA